MSTQRKESVANNLLPGTSDTEDDMGAVGNRTGDSSVVNPKAIDEPMGEEEVQPGDVEVPSQGTMSSDERRQMLARILSDPSFFGDVAALARVAMAKERPKEDVPRMRTKGWPDLRTEKGIDAWIRAFEQRGKMLKLSDDQMGIEAAGLVSDQILNSARNALGKDLEGNWSTLKRALLLIADGANPVLAAGRKLMTLFAVKQKGGLDEIHDRVRAAAISYFEACEATGKIRPDHLYIPVMYNCLEPAVSRAIPLELALKDDDPMSYIYRRAREGNSAGVTAQPDETVLMAKGRSADIECFKCGQRGHISRNCTNSKLQTETGVATPLQKESSKGQESLSSLSRRGTAKMVTARLRLSGVECSVVIDTGATVNLLASNTVRQLELGVTADTMAISGVNTGGSAVTHGKVKLEVATPNTAGLTFGVTAQVMDLPSGVVAIFGTPFLVETKAVIDFNKEEITFMDQRKRKIAVPFEPIIERDEGVRTREVWYATERTTIPPFMQRIVQVRSPAYENRYDQVLVASCEKAARDGALVGKGVIDVKGGLSRLLVCNMSNQPLSLCNGSPVAESEPHDAETAAVYAVDLEGDMPSEFSDDIDRAIPPELDLSCAKRRITRKQFDKLRKALHRTAGVWRKTNEPLGSVKVAPHVIDTGDSRPVCQQRTELNPGNCTSPGSAWGALTRWSPVASGSIRENAKSFPYILR